MKAQAWTGRGERERCREIRRVGEPTLSIREEKKNWVSEMKK